MTLACLRSSRPIDPSLLPGSSERSCGRLNLPRRLRETLLFSRARSQIFEIVRDEPLFLAGHALKFSKFVAEPGGFEGPGRQERRERDAAVLLVQFSFDLVGCAKL